MNSVVVKSVDLPAVRRAMDKYAAELLSRAAVEEVVVFGSFASGTYAPGSDLDVLVVLTASDVAPWERAGSLRPSFAFPVPVDVFPFTRAELAARAETPFAAALTASSWRYQERAPENR